MPELTEKKALQREVGKFASLEAVATSNGGKVIINGLKKDAVAALDTIIGTFSTLPEIQLRSLCATLKERIALIRVFQHAGKNKKLTLKELEELLALDNSEEDNTI